MEKEGVEMLFYADKDYPNRIKQCNDSPLTLYYKGNPNFNAKGCNELIKNQKAILLESIDDIIKELNWDLPEKKSKQTQLNIKLTNEERRLVNLLEEKMHIDAIASEINWSFTRVSQILLQLEFSGVIQFLPGKIYKRVE